MTRQVDYATPARSEDAQPGNASHSHWCEFGRHNYGCDRPNCQLPAEAPCPPCSASVALSLARSGWAALREADEARREGGDQA